MKFKGIRKLSEAPLTARGFPESGNSDFVGAGERTNYVDHECNKTVGLPVSKSTRIIAADGKVIEIHAHQRVYVTAPGKLYRGRDIKLKPDNGVFTLASLKSMDPDDSEGYMPLSHIVKPAGKLQSRIESGATSQEFVANQVKQMLGDHRVEVVSIAKKGSAVGDVILKIDGEHIQFEVKGTRTTNKTQPITFFDKSMRRGTRNKLLDDFAKIISHDEAQDFTELVDQYKAINPKIGFAGDEGVGKSGKLPKEFQVTHPPELLSKLKKDLLQHLVDSKDNYFAIHYRGSNKVDFFHTGHGPNPLQAPMLPDLLQFKVGTYGGPSSGATRVALKIKLA